MFKMINFLFFAQKVFSGMGALRPKFLGASGTRTPARLGAKGVQICFFHCLFSLFIHLA